MQASTKSRFFLPGADANSLLSPSSCPIHFRIFIKNPGIFFPANSLLTICPISTFAIFNSSIISSSCYFAYKIKKNA